VGSGGVCWESREAGKFVCPAVWNVRVVVLRCLCSIVELFALLLLSRDWAYSAVLGSLNARMGDYLVQMMPDRRLCYWAHVA
jgi:F0F1-type ATP synthase assembly protein I